MKKLILFIVFILASVVLKAQNAPTTAEVRDELAKYPTVRSDFCDACVLWINPYYRSIADTIKHIPLVNYEVYTKENAILADHANFGRTGIYSAWHNLPGQENEDNVYHDANDTVKKYDTQDEIAKGHVQAWVLNRFSSWACIFSDVYTFNAAAEHQGQNVGTEIATENLTRQLLKTNDTVRVWGGCYVDNKNEHIQKFTDGKVTDTEPTHYWKIIKYGETTLCYWMPNLKTESQAMLPDRIVTYQELINKLGFDPEKVFN